MVIIPLAIAIIIVSLYSVGVINIPKNMPPTLDDITNIIELPSNGGGGGSGNKPPSDKGGLSLSACPSDKFGNCLNFLEQAVLTFPGGEPQEGIKYISITSSLVASGTAPTIEIYESTAIPSVYNTEVGSQMTSSFNLGNVSFNAS